MDALSLARTLGSLLLVLALLFGALWLVKRHGPMGSRPFRRAERRLAVIERLTLDPKHSIYLMARDGGELLLAVGPAGIVELSPVRVEGQAEVTAEPLPTEETSIAVAAPSPDTDRFAAVLDRIRAAREQTLLDRSPARVSVDA